MKLQLKIILGKNAFIGYCLIFSCTCSSYWAIPTAINQHIRDLVRALSIILIHDILKRPQYDIFFSSYMNFSLYEK